MTKSSTFTKGTNYQRALFKRKIESNNKGKIWNGNYLNTRQQPFDYYDYWYRNSQRWTYFWLSVVNQLKMFIHCLEKHEKKTKTIWIP